MGLERKAVLVAAGILALVIGVSVYELSLGTGNEGSTESFVFFTVRFNCSIPEVPEQVKILSVRAYPVSGEKLVELAVDVFGFVNYTIEQGEDGPPSVVSENMSLRCDGYYVMFEDSSVNRDRLIEVNRADLRARGEAFIQLLYSHLENPAKTELVEERLEYHDLKKTGEGYISLQPQYFVFYHYLNGTPVLSLSTEYHLGFAEDRLANAYISSFTVAEVKHVETALSPREAVKEAFPGAAMPGGIGVASQAAVPVRGEIIIQDLKLFYFNWDSVKGVDHELYPTYRIAALIVGPDASGRTRMMLVTRWIRAVR